MKNIQVNHTESTVDGYAIGVWAFHIRLLLGIGQDFTERANQARHEAYRYVRDKSGLDFENFGDEPERWINWLRANNVDDYSLRERVRDERLKERADIATGKLSEIHSPERTCYSFWGGVIDMLKRVKNDQSSDGKEERRHLYQLIRSNSGFSSFDRLDAFAEFKDNPDKWLAWLIANDTNDFEKAWLVRDENIRCKNAEQEEYRKTLKKSH